MPKTSIEWCDYSWPVLNGCRRKSPGCEHCYAERLAATRLRHNSRYKGLAVYGKNGPRWTGETRLWAPELAMPLKLRKPSRIFVADMGDLFYEGVRDEDIAAVFGVMAACPQHTFQILTKRPARMLEWLNTEPSLMFCAGMADELMKPTASIARKLYRHFDDEMGETDVPWPLPNVWIGVSAEDQQRADERIPLLLQCPAAVRFVSAEPLLGPIDFEHIGNALFDREAAIKRQMYDGALLNREQASAFIAHPELSWVIVGGESGPGSRPFDLAWARSIVEQCRAAEVACFVKQLGARPMLSDNHPPFEQSAECIMRHGEYDPDPITYPLRDRKGGDMTEWPEDLRVREFPAPRSA